jgi:pyruvate formate lyase activating enzyme
MRMVGLQRVSLLDYTDKIAATVFLAGCNLDCGYCHNRWMIDGGAAEAISVRAFTDWLATRRGLLDGVCVSGGEPTLAPDLADLLRAIKDLGFAVKLDTNGTRPDALGALLDEGLVDMVAMDLKAPLDARYAEVAGRPVDVAALRRSMAHLRRWGGHYEFRTTVGPQVGEEWLRDIARELRPDEAWYLQAFRPAEGVAPALATARAPDEETLAEIAARLAPLVPGVRVRGLEA